MITLEAKLRDPEQKLNGLCLQGDEARAELGIQVLPAHAQTFAGMHVAVYLRISDDKLENESGVRRQAVDTVWHVLQRGAASVTIYEENDTSAYKKRRVLHVEPSSGSRYWVWRVIRPGWQAMLTALRTGTQQGVCVANMDRLARDPRDLEDAIELAEYYKRRFEGVTGSLDLNTDDGRAMARVMVAMQNKASADTARRTRRKHLELAEAGVPVGAYRPFGWKPDRKTKDPVESKEIEDAVDKILAGVKISAIVVDWQSRGILTTPGNRWRWSSFVTMLRNPRLCGLRSRVIREIDEEGKTHSHWEIVTKPDGTEVTGLWEAIITREKWDALIKIIGTERGGTRNLPGGTRKHLLGGLLRCGRCPTLPRMSGIDTLHYGKPYLRYQCASPLHGGCGANTRPMEVMDNLIRELVFRYHDQRGGEAVVVPDAVIDEARIAEIDELLADAYAAWKAKELPSKDYFAMRNDLTSEKEELESEKALAEQDAMSSDFQIDVRNRWDDPSVTVHERRAFIERYIELIIVHPIEPTWNERKRKMTRSRVFDEDLIEPIWR